MTATEKAEILIALREILNEAIRLYESNGRQAYEAGRVDGCKWCIDEIRKII